MPIAGWISDSSYGWPVVFYLYGALGVFWSIIWFLVGYDNPSKHPNISTDERNYIQSGMRVEDTDPVRTFIAFYYFSLLPTKLRYFLGFRNSLEIHFYFCTVLGYFDNTLWTKLWFLDIAY